MDVPVVGLMGINGSGKSTILEAIKFAFTGILPDKNETYVRNWFLEDGPDVDKPKNAKVYLKFIKDGKVGQIFRQIGTNPRRFLKWEGEEITKVADIEEKLKEIFDADKEARANAIFPPQGSLDKLLFGTPGERLELFTKLLLVGFMNKVCDAADQQSRILLSQVQDYTTLLTELKGQHTEAEENLGELETKLQAEHDWNEDQVLFAKYREAVEDFQVSQNRKKELKHQIEVAEQEVNMTVTEIGTVLGIEHATINTALEAVQQLETDIDTLSREVTDLGRIKARKQAKEECDEHREKLLEKIAELDEYLEGTADHSGEIDALREDLRIQQHRQQLTDDISGVYAARLESLQKELEEIPPPPADEEIKKAQLAADEAQAAYMLVHGKELALESLINSGNSEDGNCPLCGQSAHQDPTDWIIQMKQAKAEARELKEKSFSATSAKNVLIGKSNSTNTRIEGLQQSIKLEQENIIQLSKELRNIPVHSIGDLEATIESLQQAGKSADEAHLQKASLAREIQSLELGLGPITEEDAEAMAQWSDATWEFKNNELQYALEKRQEIRLKNSDDKIIDLVKATAQSIETSETELQVHQQYQQSMKEAIQVHAMGLPETTLKVIDKHSSNYDQIERELKENATEYNSLQGQVDQAEKQADGVQKRLDEIEQHIEQDKLRQRVVSDLKNLKEAFNKKGIPQAYLQYVFENLTPIAQDNLNTLGADFVIEPNPDSPVTIQFMKLTDEESGWMPQTKLSGGQKVRVSIAYLLAIQQLVIPDIAFLVLDEPSTHIDDDGVEAMKELFSTLGEQLQHTEAQIIVCDHKPELQSSFQETINLR